MLKKENIFQDHLSDEEFLRIALELFNFQYINNPVYRRWTDLLKIPPESVQSLEQLPFLPVEFFKSHQVISTPVNAKTVRFTSSATTSQIPATHFVNDVSFYEESFLKCFNFFYGSPEDYCILALLPNYLQRQGSSLVYMCAELIRRSNHRHSGFFLDNVDDLLLSIEQLNSSHQKVVLIGVSYALMDLCDRNVALNKNFTVMETGGMKGTRKELLKPELHDYLKNGFQVTSIHSEYGMTELLSQGYSTGNGEFRFPSWVKPLVREVDDPLKMRYDHRTGGINMIDLANINSCSFIATKDLGRITENGTLELMGRYDNSDVRGCNLMVGGF